MLTKKKLVEMSEELFSSVQEFAKENNTSFNAMTRDAITEYLARRQQPTLNTKLIDSVLNDFASKAGVRRGFIDMSLLIVETMTFDGRANQIIGAPLACAEELIRNRQRYGEAVSVTVEA